MKPEELTLLGIIITSVITILGWIVTALIQIKILLETRKINKRDQEISIFRSRMTKISKITSLLLEESNYYFEIVSECITLTFNIERNTKRVEELRKIEMEIIKIFYDPEYLSILTNISEIAREDIKNKIQNISQLSKEFLTISLQINTKMDINDPIIADLGNHAFISAKHLLDTARAFGEEFSKVDSKLSEINKSQKSLLLRIVTRIKRLIKRK